MRVAYVCADSGVPVFGAKGSSVHAQEVIRGLLRRGTDIDLFAARLGEHRPQDFTPIRVHRLRAPQCDGGLQREQSALQLNDRLAAELEQFGPYDFVYERYSLWSYAAMEYSRRKGIPGLLEVNAPLISEQSRHRQLIDRAAAERVADRVMRAAEALLAVSEEVSDYLIERTGSSLGIHVVPNGVDVARFSDGVVPTLPEAAATFTVGFTGTMKPWHGLDVLSKAFAIVHVEDPSIGLLAVGDGPDRAAFERDLRSRLPGATNNVWFTGAVCAADVPGLLASMSVGVAPYPQIENFYFSPLKIYEYMAAGVPVVASRIGDIPRLIEDGQTGLLCAPGDPASLARSILRLRKDPQLYSELSRAARNRVVARHTWAKVVERILELGGCYPPQYAHCSKESD